MKRFSMRVCVLVFACLAGLAICRADELAAVTGLVTDPNGRSVPGVTILITNLSTNVASKTVTNDQGIYRVPSLQPGIYRMTLDRDGFKSIVKSGVELHVQDVASINFELQIGSVNETVTVESGGLVINTTDASVSTVIDRQFAESLPLNGRSFNTLLQLTPGVVIGPTNGFSPGQFSIAGQRSNANNFSIDGASANFGVSAINIAQSGTGAAQAFSAFGGTSSLVSVEALQEFRIETSSFAPEFGRTPGGQVILTTRSGTNDFHGGVYDYFRNTVMDANDWFANQAGNPRAPEHHNDFGGFLGGPIWKDRTFFFFSYEGARLDLPQTQAIQVPSRGVRTASSTPAALVPYLDAYPLPNGPVSPGGFTARFTGTYANRGDLDATSVRIDHTFSSRYSIFGRYNYAPSKFVSRLDSLSELTHNPINTQTLTVGLNMLPSNRISNTLRANYSTQRSNASQTMDSFGGAVPFNPSAVLGSLSIANSRIGFGTLFADIGSFHVGPATRAKTSQFNFIDDLGITVGSHQLKFGGDYRDIFLDVDYPQHSATFLPTTVQAAVNNGNATLSAATRVPAKILTQSLSIYAQDTWKVTSRLGLTYGLRWELSPAPSGRGNTRLAAWENVTNPPQLALAPSGTPLWNTTHDNFAPRVGVAYSLTEKGDFVVRAGGGVFYDLGVGSSGGLATQFPNLTVASTPGVPFSITDVSPFLPAISLNPPFPNQIEAFLRSLKLPRSYQWNVALEKSFGTQQAVSITYLGQAGRDLLRNEANFQPNANFSGEVFTTLNNASSDYNALQLQYRRRLSKGVQALLNYTWSHAIDNASDDSIVSVGLSNTVISAARDRGNSSFDVRQSFSGALTYAVPAAAKSGPLGLLTRDWSLDTVVIARGGLPFNAQLFFTSPDPGFAVTSRPDRVPGQPFFTPNPTAPGGKILNTNAFSIPSTVRQGTESRNDIPGFGLTQVDLSIGRKFPITERLNLQFRADAFNVLNHPNFSNPVGLVEVAIFGPAFLQSMSMINSQLGAQGLNPLFSQGGPRSLQLSLKLNF